MKAQRPLVLALLAFSASACERNSRTAPRGAPVTAAAITPNGVKVVVVTPRKGQVKQDLGLPGNLLPYDKARLYAKVTGYLQAITVDLGDRVKKGAVLARLSIPELHMQVARAAADIPAARARLTKAEADAELADVTYQRIAGLHKKDRRAITKQEVDMAAAQRKVARAQVAIAVAMVRVARAKHGQVQTLLGYGTLRAPFDGVVTKRFADIGALITKGSSQPVVDLARVDRLRLAIDVPGPVVPYVKVGSAVRFTISALPGRSFTGTVARSAGALANDTRSMRAEIDVSNRDETLRPGMYATVQLGVRDIPGALSLPSTTIRSSEGKTFVYAVVDGVVRHRPVTVLLDDGATAVVIGQLDVRSAVIKAGPATLAPGSQVIAHGQTTGKKR